MKFQFIFWYDDNYSVRLNAEDHIRDGEVGSSLQCSNSLLSMDLPQQIQLKFLKEKKVSEGGMWIGRFNVNLVTASDGIIARNSSPLDQDLESNKTFVQLYTTISQQRPSALNVDTCPH
ncbi:unnamed protein product [Allacma fusca]|uniref:Uncharacterized protein n=1 Tax=Allacma fusca TaxID=39272 RepID=A0A8J2NZF1_9HEXA|nr:unnamed protein product [Allacma fusca]